MTFKPSLCRHDLVALTPEAWDAAVGRTDLLSVLCADQALLVAGWARRGWPLVVRRRAPQEATDALPVALPLPPALGKLRLATSLPADTLIATRPSVGLEDAADAVPASWRGTIAAIVALGSALGTPPRVFGALLWQHLTGLDYLHPGSDLDLLWPLADAAPLAPLIEELRRLDRTGPVRIDGEVILSDGGAVNWRELAQSMGEPRVEVLVKSMAGLALRRADALFPASAAWPR